MINSFVAIRDLGYPKWIEELCTGSLNYPPISWSTCEGWYPHPPAFIPILAENSLPSYLGVLRHWFVKRAPSFCYLSIEDNGALYEISRTAEQFSVYLMLNSIAMGCSSDQVSEFAMRSNFFDFDKVLEHANKYGDDIKQMWSYWGTKEGLPREMVDSQGEYDGDFVCPESYGMVEREFPENKMRAPFSIVDRFNTFYKENRFTDAWILLNSPGWNVEDAIVCLVEMRRISPSPYFNLQCQQWIDRAKESRDLFY